MFGLIILVTALACSSQGFPRPEPPPAVSGSGEPALYNIYIPDERQQHLRLDFPFLDPYNFINEKQPSYPRVDEPQIFLFHGGGGPGQHFLLQPGSPPGNFLVPQPQPGPNVILRDSPLPQRPIFVAGYPKPAHIPPIEKDAEEIPTNPSKIPPLIQTGRKPEKLETFNEPEKNDIPKKTATEAEVLAAADRNPYFNNKNNLKPGQRFFILNGQSLFNYPLTQNYPHYSDPNVNLKLTQPLPHVYRNGVTGQIEDVVAANKYRNGINIPTYENLVLFNQPGDFQSQPYFRHSEELQGKDETKADKQQYKIGNDQEIPNFGNFYQLATNDDSENDAIVIDARDQEENTEAVTDSEVVSAPERSAEPTIAQAQPGAIALAGPGGVAAAAPRGTAFVGREGVAVSSPQATAVAGPSRDEPPQKRRKQNKGRRQE